MVDYAGLDAALHEPPTGWYRMGERPARGAVAAARLGTVPVVGWAGPDDEPVAVVGVCAHLGADLSGGSVVDGCLTCPFHGWRYHGDGSHAGTPDGVVVPAARLGALSAQWVGDDLYAFWDGGRGERPWSPRGPVWAAEAAALAADPEVAVETRVVDREMGAPPVIVAEGAFDVAHFAEVHRVAPDAVRWSFAGPTASVAFTIGTGRTSFGFAFELDGLTSLRETITRDRYRIHRVFSLYAAEGGWRSRVVSTGSGPRAKAVGLFLDQLEQAALDDLGQDADLWAHRDFTRPSVYGPADRALREFRAWAVPFLVGGVTGDGT